MSARSMRVIGTPVTTGGEAGDTDMSRILYQFPLSHYSEKSRWNLDFKRLDYQCCSLVPGPHLLTARRLAGQSTLPILRDADRIVGDSTRIALYLDEHYPEHPLLPSAPDELHRVMALEALADDLGVHVRRCVWSVVIEEDSINRLFFDFGSYSSLIKSASGVLRPVLRLMIRQRFGVWQVDTEESWKVLQAMMEMLTRQLDGHPENYLVGDSFTLADLAMAAMLAPLVGPAGSPWSDTRVQKSAESSRSVYRETVVGQWVERIYLFHRSQPLSR